MHPNMMQNIYDWQNPLPQTPMVDNEGRNDLQKALTAGTDIASPGAVAGSGFPLRPESLDGTLYNLSYRMQHLQLWPQLLKEDVFNTVNEFNVLRAHGSGSHFFHGEGDLPGEDDSTWQRMYSTVKMMGCTRRYTLVSSLVRMAHASAETHQTLGGTMWILEQLEKALFTGDSSLLSESFNGYDAQISNVIDMRGQPLTGDAVNWGSGLVFDAPNYGMATDLYMPVGADTDFVDDVLPNARYNINPQGYTNGHAGMQVKVYDTQRGPIALRPNVFLSFGTTPDATAAGDAAKRPGSPTISVAPAAAASGVLTSYFTAGDAGAYRYKIVAHNAYGRSIPVTVSASAVTVAADEKVTFTILDGSPVASYYAIYRTAAGGAAGTEEMMMKVARDTSGSTVITDLNAYIPGTGTSYLVQQNREFNLFKRLLRFMKVNLAQVDSSFRFMLLLFGDLVVHSPNKGVIFRNVGRISRTPPFLVV